MFIKVDFMWLLLCCFVTAVFGLTSLTNIQPSTVELPIIPSTLPTELLEPSHPTAGPCSSRILSRERRVWRNDAPDSLPPRAPPTDLVAAFTRCGTVPLGDYFVDDSNRGKGTHYRYNAPQMAKQIEAAKRLVAEVAKVAAHPAGTAEARSKKEAALVALQARGQPAFLAEALRRHAPLIMAVNNSRIQTAAPNPLEKTYINTNTNTNTETDTDRPAANPWAHTRAVVFGSQTPVVEALLFAVGVLSVTTVEYNRLSYDGVDTLTPAELELRFAGAGSEGSDPRFGLAVSLSSFDHDGLGRYGDPLAPDGDLLSSGDCIHSADCIIFWAK